MTQEPDFYAEVDTADAFTMDADAPQMRFTVISDWTSWSSPRGVVVTCRAPGENPYFVHDMSLEEAEAYGRALLAAAAARRAHPPTPAEDVLRAYEQIRYDEDPRDPDQLWIDVATIRARAGLPEELFAATLAAMRTAGQLDVDGVAVARLRPSLDYAGYWEHESREFFLDAA